MDEQEEIQQNNMISNLPLLFANGYPTSLEKISEAQLEQFIPFMVQCSLGHINIQGKVDSSEPEWWPEDIPFSIPLAKPKKFTGNWLEKLKEVVLICYQFHKSVFLLRFCNDLSSYEHASLRFINNYNSTTSLFDRRSNKLLVTFRNENMSYDQPFRHRKGLLLQQKSKNATEVANALPQMVEAAPFDIYLCDNCDAELYSTEAILEHEKTCKEEDDDDVILCNTPEPMLPEQTCSSLSEDDEQRIGFLFNFNLKFRHKEVVVDPKQNVSYKLDDVHMAGDKKKRINRRNRSVHSLSRCPSLPLSSPAGQILLKSSTAATAQYLSERLERMERFCHAPLLSKLTARPKYMDSRKQSITAPHCSFKKPPEYSNHVYVFPRRQFSQKRRTEDISLLNSTLLRRCRPISVRLRKISEIERRSHKHQHTLASTKLNIKLTRDNSRSSSWKISSSCPTTEIIVDTIDLCSSDDELMQVEEASVSLINSKALNISCVVDSTSSSPVAAAATLTETTVGAVNCSASKSKKPAILYHSKQISSTTSSNFSRPEYINDTDDHSLYKELNIANKSFGAAPPNSSDVNFMQPFRSSLYILSTSCSTQDQTPAAAAAAASAKTQRARTLDNACDIQPIEILQRSSTSLIENLYPTTTAGNSNSSSSSSRREEHIMSAAATPASKDIDPKTKTNAALLQPRDDQKQRLRALSLVHQNRILSIDLTS